MSKFTTTFVSVVAAGFFALAAWLVAKGAYGPALTSLVLCAVVAFIGSLGWFESKYPLPPLPPGTRPTLIREAFRYLEHYPGWPGKVAFMVGGGLFLFALVVAILRMAGHGHA